MAHQISLQQPDGTFQLLTVFLLMMFNCSSLAGQHELGTKGYARIGTGASQEGEKECFKAPGASTKYRLGNECDIWVELDAHDTYYLNETKTGAYIRTEGMLTFSGADEKSVEFNDLSQIYVEMGHFSPMLGEAKIWVGRRWFDRHDIHINDFFFWNNLSGDGGGIYDIKLGWVDVAYTYLQEEEVPTLAGITFDDKIVQRNHDLRFYNIPTNPNGHLRAFVNYSQIVGRTLTGDDEVLGKNRSVTIDGAEGWAIGLLHHQEKLFQSADLLTGYNKFSLQYGRGANRKAGQWAFESAKTFGQLSLPLKSADLENATTFRLTNHNLVANNQWALMTTLVYEKKNHAEFDGTDQTWFSIGVRPVKFIGQHFRLLTELGYDNVKDETTDEHGSLSKITLAGELAEKPGFWVRPVIRLFATYAHWSDNFRGKIGDEAHRDDTSGWSAGVQIETWW